MLYNSVHFSRRYCFVVVVVIFVGFVCVLLLLLFLVCVCVCVCVCVLFYCALRVHVRSRRFVRILLHY